MLFRSAVVTSPFLCLMRETRGVQEHGEPQEAQPGRISVAEGAESRMLGHGMDESRTGNNIRR